MESPKEQQEKKKFHHRHFPHFIKWGKIGLWKFLHLYFVIFIHIVTDKYEHKKHHLAMDMMYAVITFILVGINIGVGVWYIQHVEPPQFEVRFITPSEVTSGKSMNLTALYANKNKDVENVRISIYTPKDFAHKGVEVLDAHEVDLGALLKGTVDRVDHDGVIFGNTGDIHSFSVIAQYEHRGQTYYEVMHRKVKVAKTSFTASVRFPKNAAVGFPTNGVIRYNNKSDIARDNVHFTLTLPRNFVLQRVMHQKQNIGYNKKKESIIIPRIAAHQKGKIRIEGYFVPETNKNGVVSGDQESQVSLRVSSEVAGGIIDQAVSYVYIPKQVVTIRVIEPRVVATLSGSPVVGFGDSIQYTVTVTNAGDDVAENIALYLTTDGVAIAPSAASAVSSRGYTSYGGYGNVIALPVIPRLGEGKTEIISVSVPTVSVTNANVQASASLSGSAYVPLVDFTIPVSGSSMQTLFSSQVSMSVSSVYSGPSGEQLGYGPFPPQANEPTAMIIFVRINNVNNVIQNTTVSTTLPSQVEWTGQASVAAGGPITYNPGSRTVVWNIGTVPPQSGVYAAQFEVQFLPNESQIGQYPALTNGWFLNAVDTFTSATLGSSFGAVTVSAPVQKAPEEKDGVPIDEIIVEESSLGDIIIE